MRSGHAKRGLPIEEALEVALAAEGDQELVRLLVSANRSERKKCAAVVRSWANRSPAEVSERLGAKGVARVGVACLASLPIAELRTAHFIPVGAEDELVEVAGARPDLEALVRHLCCGPGRRDFRIGWRLIVEKGAPHPDDDRFWHRLVDCLLDGAQMVRLLQRAASPSAEQPGTLALELLTREVPHLQRLLAEELLEALRRPAALGADLRGNAAQRIKDFIEVLRQLYDQGELERGPLFGAILDGLAAGGSPPRDSGLLDLYRHLAPTREETCGFAPRWVNLLRAKQASTAAYALEILASLPLADRPADLLRELRPLLGGRLKSAALTALRLLDAATATDPEALASVVEALAHDNPEVQGAAIAILERHPTRAPQLAAAARPFRDRLGSALGARLDRLLGTDSDARLVPTETEATSPSPAERALHPVADLDELLFIAMDLLVGGPASEDPLEVERALDGISRLCGEPCSASRVAPVLTALDRARNLSGPQRSVLRALVGWLTEREIHPAYGYSVDDFLHHRAVAVARRTRAKRGAPLLALPTDRSGLVDPAALVARARARQSLGLEPDLLDAAQAMLRLSDTGRSAALAEAEALAGELGAAIRYALGGAEEVGASAALWVAAARARAPEGDDPDVEARHPGSGPDAGLAVRFESKRGVLYRVWAGAAAPIPENQSLLALPKSPPSAWELPSVALHYDRCGSDEATIRASALVRPGHLEPFFASGVRAITLANQARPERAYFEPLLSLRTALGPAARHLLLAGLASQEPGKRLIALEVMVKAVADGRLQAPALAESIGDRLLDPKLVGRWTKALAEVARTSPEHRAFIGQLSAALPAREDGRPVFAALI